MISLFSYFTRISELHSNKNKYKHMIAVVVSLFK